MLVPPLAVRSEAAAATSSVAPVTAVAAVTRVALADLLGSLGGNAREQQAFASLLRSNGTLTARVLETRANGVSVLELLNARVSLKLATAVPPGTLLQIGVDDRAAPAPAASAATTATAAQVKLSSSAALIDGIRKSVFNQFVTDEIRTRPLSDGSASPQRLARDLQQAVRSSGLFYESHLRGWVDGRIALAELYDEPQARVNDLPRAAAGDARDAGPLQREPAIHPQLEPLVRQQLNTFEQQCIVWRGTLWPGQPAEIVISGEPEAEVTAEAPRAWRVRLTLDTPALGPVAADVALSGRALQLQLRGDGAAAPILRRGCTALAEALAAHDLDVKPIRIAGDAP